MQISMKISLKENSATVQKYLEILKRGCHQQIERTIGLT